MRRELDSASSVPTSSPCARGTRMSRGSPRFDGRTSLGRPRAARGCATTSRKVLSPKDERYAQTGESGLPALVGQPELTQPRHQRPPRDPEQLGGAGLVPVAQLQRLDDAAPLARRDLVLE